jgi:hypothetical protein
MVNFLLYLKLDEFTVEIFFQKISIFDIKKSDVIYYSIYNI